MGGSTHEIKRRIKAMKSTSQVTRTMQLVAASKMRRAQLQALQSRAYAERALDILMHLPLQKDEKFHHPLFEKRIVQKTLVLLLTSDKGLCGSFNSSLLRHTLDMIRDFPKESVSFVTVGRKGREAILRMGYTLLADFSGIPDRFDAGQISALVRLIVDQYENKETDQIILAYKHFVNTASQKSVNATLLPLNPENVVFIAKQLAGKEHSLKTPDAEKHFKYLFEPDAKTVFDLLLPRFTEMQIFQSLLESRASEHSARMVAMKNATDAADDIVANMTLIFNKARQEAITSEIAEISSGAEALKEEE